MADTIEVCHVKWTKHGRYHWSLSCEVDQTSVYSGPWMADTIQVCHVKWTKHLYFGDPKWQIPSKFVMWSGPKHLYFKTLNGRYHRSLSCEVDQSPLCSGPEMADTIEVCRVKWTKILYFRDPEWQIPSSIFGFKGSKVWYWTTPFPGVQKIGFWDPVKNCSISFVSFYYSVDFFCRSWTTPFSGVQKCNDLVVVLGQIPVASAPGLLKKVIFGGLFLSWMPMVSDPGRSKKYYFANHFGTNASGICSRAV